MVLKLSIFLAANAKVFSIHFY